jgi:hypothetical protein
MLFVCWIALLLLVSVHGELLSAALPCTGDNQPVFSLITIFRETCSVDRHY